MALKPVGKVKAISSKFKWHINDFRTCCNKRVGEFLESPKFIASTVSRDIQWCLILYPRGDGQDNKDYLSLFLHANKQVTAVSNFKILNNKLEAVVNRTIEEYAFGKTAYGYPKLISTDFVTNRENGMIRNGNLTIVCEITTMPQYRVKEIKLNKEAEEQDDVLPRLAVIEKYKTLFNNNKFSDVSLISSEGKTVMVHKCILANSSPVFAAMFDAEMKETQENTVEIADIRYDVLLEMVRYIYTGKVNSIDTLIGELATAADKYALDGLKYMCERRLIKNLNVDNVVECVQFADRLNMDKLKKEAIEFIVANAVDVTDRPEFELLSRDMLRKVCCGLAKMIYLALICLCFNVSC